MKFLKAKKLYLRIIQLLFLYGIVMLMLSYKNGYWNKSSEVISGKSGLIRANQLQHNIGEVLTKREQKDEDNEISKGLSLNDSLVKNYIEALKRRVLRPNQPSIYKKPKQNDIPPDKVAIVNYNKTVLLQKLGENWQWNFTRKRIDANWDLLVQATKFAINRDLIPDQYTKKKVLVTPGVLEFTPFAKLFSNGDVGPLGELVQWSDLIAGLYILGHDVELQYDSTEAEQVLQEKLSSQPLSSNGCGCIRDDFDYIYTDLMGHSHLSAIVKNTYKRKFRILDLFGTEQAYNNIKYANRKETSRTGWGRRGLHLKQFYTIYPQTPDNSFLGHMIFNTTKVNTENRHIAYLYGKEPHLLKGRPEVSQIVPILQKYTEVHSSFIEMPQELALYQIVNHGHLNPKEYGELAQKTKVLVGLGRPEEGPGFLEAIAKGCVLINPARGNKWKYPGKPTFRTFTSQHPYSEKFIGPPYVFTVDYSNTTLLEEIVKIALKVQVKPFIPFELTPVGFLQRLYTLLEFQNWCSINKPIWPPLSSMKVILGDRSRSCNEVCEGQGLVCENLHFPVINNKTFFKQQNIHCKTEVFKQELYAPCYFAETSTCVFQKDQGLYSCASYDGPTPEIKRLCPCRDFIKYQIHMCRTC